MRDYPFQSVDCPPSFLHDIGSGTPVVPLLSLVPQLAPGRKARALLYGEAGDAG